MRKLVSGYGFKWTSMVYGYLVRRLTFMGLSRLGYALWAPEPPTLANLLQHEP